MTGNTDGSQQASFSAYHVNISLEPNVSNFPLKAVGALALLHTGRLCLLPTQVTGWRHQLVD